MKLEYIACPNHKPSASGYSQLHAPDQVHQHQDQHPAGQGYGADRLKHGWKATERHSVLNPTYNISSGAGYVHVHKRKRAYGKVPEQNKKY